MPAHDLTASGWDQLTWLPDRSVFLDRLRHLLDRPPLSRRIGVCFVDLDRFEAVNDGFGHELGDRLLVVVAERLRAVLRPYGHLLVRLDSDKFAVLLEASASSEQATELAGAVIAAVAEPFDVDGRRLSITASAGVVERAAPGAEVEMLIHAADLALHWAKADGRARVVLYDPNRGAEQVARLNLTADIPQALAHNDFVLHYQPQVDLGDGSLVGFEALARWHHPTRGLLEPGEFIDLIDEGGHAVQLGTALLNQACREAAQWPVRDGRQPFVAVNLAPAQIRHPGLVRAVVRALAESRLRPDALRLEITEGAIIDTSPAALAPLQELADTGVGIVLDDFGTGYANLASLPMLPLKGVKLDRSFVSRMDAHSAANTKKFLRAVVSLGHSIDLSVTAEGIENRRQERLMRDLGCDIGQGWLFGKPAPQAFEMTRAMPSVFNFARRPRLGFAAA